MEHRIALTSLSPREAVADALYRTVVGIDDNNREMFESGILNTKEASFSIGERTIQGFDAIKGYIYGKVFDLHTTHFITNVRVDVKDGADTAYLTANAIAYHIKPEDALTPNGKPYTTGGLYSVDLVKDSSDGLWKIKTWRLKLNWTDGDRAVITGETPA